MTNETTMTAESNTGKQSASGSKKPKDAAQNVYQLISAVAGELAQEGISKKQRNTQGAGYNFRGIDDVYNAIGPLLAKHGLSILPRTLARECVERVSGQGKALFYVTVEMEFDFVSAHDQSKHTVKMFGEAMDSGDKATNKAMSAAYKYAMFQAFCIPTEGDNDADSSTHTVQARNTATGDVKDVPRLSAEQVTTIESLATEYGKPIENILKFYNVSSLPEIPASAYAQIERSLKKQPAAPTTTATAE